MSRRLSVLSPSRYAIAVVTFTWLMLSLVAPVVHAQTVNEELLAQKAFVAPIVTGMALTKTATGVPLAVTMPESVDALLEVINLNTMQRVFLQEQARNGKEVSATAYVTLPNRHVLIGTSAGLLYDLNPDKLTVSEQVPTDVPKASLHTAMLGEGNEVYLSSADTTGTHLLAYNYVKMTWRELTTLAGAEAGAAYSAPAIYAGNMETASLWRVSPSTGSKEQVALSGTPKDITGMKVQLVDNGMLYATGYGGPEPRTLVYDLAKGNLVDDRTDIGAISKAPVQAVSVPVAQPNVSPANTPSQAATTTPSSTPSASTDPSDHPQATPVSEPATPATPVPQQPSTSATAPVASPATVYFGGLSRYEPSAKLVKVLVVETGLQPVAGNCWIDSNRCVVYGGQGKIGIVSVSTRTLKLAIPSPIVGGAHNIGNITIGARDTVYVTSASDDPSVLQLDRDKTELRRMIAQEYGAATSALTAGTGFMVGTASGRVAVYDPSRQGAVPQFTSASQVASGTIAAITPMPDGQVAFGVSTVGKASGAVGVYSALSRTVSSLPVTVLPNETIGSLVYSGGVLYGGGIATSGAPTTGATLFVYDPSGKAAKRTVIPVPHATAITSLAVGQNGHIYGFADSTLFEVDPQTLATIRHKTFYESNLPANIQVVGNRLVASVSGKVYSIEPDILRSTYIATGSHVAVNSRGDYYYSRGGALFRLPAPRQDVATGVAMKPVGASLDLSRADLKISVIALGLLLSIVIIMVIRKYAHRPTYSIRR